MELNQKQELQSWPDTRRLLYGLSNAYIVEHTFGEQTIRLHNKVVRPLESLLAELKKANLEVRILSHWRNFEYQLGIWTRKWSGQTTLLDRNAKVLDSNKLSPDEKISSLFYWSALPGLSRHHWGTDFDIFLSSPIENSYQVQLIPEEFEPNGICGDLNEWLDNQLEKHRFYRPYDKDRGGVSPEPWHISYKPVAKDLQKKITATEVAAVIEGSEIPEKKKILNLIPDYIKQYVENVAV